MSSFGGAAMGEVRVRSGRQARQAERAQKGGGMGRPYIVRNIPTYDVLSEENLFRIEAAADRVLAETGIEFRLTAHRCLDYLPTRGSQSNDDATVVAIASAWGLRVIDSLRDNYMHLRHIERS
jgi:trimethylamine:corrinoid methyltransferase-like protein